MKRRAFWLVAVAASLVAPAASAQQPYPPQQPYYPPQQQQPYYPPQQQQPYYPPQQQQPYYPPQQQQPYYPPQQQQPYYPPQQPAQTPPNKRSAGEMTFLYLTSGLYGVGTGVWLDALFKIDDPGPAVILPITLGAAAPIGVYVWDELGGPLHRGVPASVATGLGLGAVEGIAISGTQWQHANDANEWSFKTQTTITFLMATGGGVGGWAFGEWLRPDPRGLGLVAGGAAWGAASGTMLGAGVGKGDWKDGASIAGLVGYNVGIAAGGAISLVHTPSWSSQKYMWLGYGIGTVAGFLVYPFYLFVDDPTVRHGLIANAFGGLAGAGIAGALTWDLKDAEDAPKTAFKPPVDLAILPPPRLTTRALATSPARTDAREDLPVGPPASGAVLTAIGTF